MLPRTADDWTRIRADYEAGIEAIAAIAAREGVNVASIHKRARRHGWRARRAADQSAAWRERVLARLRQLSEELGQSVTALGSEPPAEASPRSSLAPSSLAPSLPAPSSQPSSEESHDGSTRGTEGQLDEVERRVRLLQSLVRSVQALARLEGADGAGAARARARQVREHVREDDDDIAAMRRELERRLDRAVAQG